MQADGKILVGGSFTTLAGQPRLRLGRLNADGTLDATFNPGANADVRGFALSTDGTIFAGGAFTVLGGQPRFYLGSLGLSGLTDSAFAPDADGEVNGLTIQADGKIVVGGRFNLLDEEPRSRLGRLTGPSAALQQITLNADGTLARWSRSGAAPEIEQVTFDQSTDGTNYTAAAAGTRVSGGWERAGLALPSGQTFYLRARGRATGGQGNGSSSLLESVAQFHLIIRPRLFAPVKVAGGSFRFSFTNMSASTFNVLASTNVNLPTASWTLLGPATSLGGSLFQFTDPAATNSPRRFYQLRSP